MAARRPYSYLLGCTCVFALLSGAPVAAQPAGGVVVSGQAGISSGGNTTVINQSTRKAVINWQDFSVTTGGTVQFAQPDAQSITLNRVIGSGASAIDGTLTANGQVWILNPNGVLFGQGAQVNVGGLLATTADIADGDFAAGDYAFTTGDGTAGAVIANRGTIHAARGGSVVLSASRVSNSGLIQADAGSVVLGGAQAFTLDFTGDNLLRYAVATPAAQNSTGADISNSGRIVATGGKVLLTARAAASVVDGVVNNTGIIEAVSAREVDGKIILDAGQGTTHAGGTLDASGKAAGETGGLVQVLGKTVQVADGADIDVSGDAGGGEVLIGGNFHGAGPQANAQKTTVGKATIDADAINNGDGGRVAVWSDGQTQFAGAISARGGAVTGDGGWVETSGSTLGIDPGASVITSALAGASGEWLLDPDNLLIVDTGSEDAVLSGGTLAFGDAGTTIFTSTIEAAMVNGNVTLQANNDITVAGSVDSDNTGNTLELDAGRSILFTGTGSISNDGGKIVLSANDPNGVAANRETGPGTISMGSSNYIRADSIDLIVGENADGGGIGTSSAPITVNGNLHMETAGYDAFVAGFDLVLGNADHAMAVDLNGGDLTLTVVGLTQTAPIAVNDLTIGLVGDISSANPISLMNTGNAITGTVNAQSLGGSFGGPNQIEITNSQAIAIGDITVFADPLGESAFGDYGAIQIVTTAGGITINGEISGGGITLHAVGNIVETANGLITSHGAGDGFVGGGLAISSFEGMISLPNANAIIPSIVCIDGCDTPQEQINAGQLSLGSAGSATVNFITPVDLYGANTGGAFSLTVFGDYNVNDAEGTPQTVYNAINIYNPINAGGDVTLYASGDIVQRTDITRDVHITTPTGVHATSENGSIDLSNGGNLGEISGEDIGFDPGNQIGGDINGYSVFNSAGDTRFTNTVDTILGGPAYYPIDPETGEPIIPEYPFTGEPTAPPADYNSPVSTIGGNLKINIVDPDFQDANHPVLLVAGRVQAENSQGGYSVLHASGDITNNNGYGTIIVGTSDGEFNDLSLVSDYGDVGGDDGTHWSFGLGTKAGVLNLHAEAVNGEIVINPGDLNIGLDFVDEGNEPLFPTGIETNYFLVFGNGTVTQNADETGRIDTHALDIHAYGDITLDNAKNTVSGTVDFYAHEKYDSELQDYVASDITFHNSVDTVLTRATGVSPNGQPDAVPLRAGNVTIIVEDTSGETTPTLTLGNRGFINGQGVAIVSSIGAEGDVYLQADGDITDGYNPQDLGSAETAGFIQANGSLTVVAEEGSISLGNPINAVNGEVDLSAGPTYDIEDPIYSDITFANSVNTTLVRANGGTMFGTYVEYANNVTILVSDPTGNTNPWLTIGNTSFIDEGDNEVLSSIDAIGNVVLLAAGIVSDGFDPDNGDSHPSAGYVSSQGTLTVTSATDEIWLQNPDNEFTGVTATTDNRDVRITASSPTGLLIVNGIDAGTGDVFLTVNNSDVTGGSITAGELTVSTRDRYFDECQVECGPPSSYAILLNGTNAVSGTVELSSTGSALFRNSIDTFLGTSTAGGTVTVLSAGDLDIVEGATITSGVPIEDQTAVLLSALGDFHNNAGSDAIDVSAGGRWLVFSQNPDTATFGGLDSGNTAVWNTVYNGEVTIGEEGNRYVFAYQPTITITSTDVQKTYGEDVTEEVATAYTITGLHEGVENAFLGDAAEDVYSGTPAVTSAGSAADADVENSPYQIVVAAGSIEVFGGYDLDLVSAGELTVDPSATLTYVADPTSRLYGSDNPTFTGTIVGFVGEDTQESSTSGTMIFTSNATAGSAIGSYAIIGSGLTSQNYAFAQDAGNATALTIDPATLTYTANAADRTYGAANPAFSGTVTGFVNNETQGSATTGTLAFTSPANASSNVGSYAINGSGLSAQNYVFVQAAGNATALTIDPATLTYTANTADRTYGAANPAFSGTVTGFVNDETQGSATTGTLSFTSAANASSNVGSYAINGSGLSAQNYTFVQAAGNGTALTIDPATLTYTADPASRPYGQDNPAFTGTVTGFVNDETQQSATTGTLTFLSPATAGSNVGSYAINGSGLSAQNYVFVEAESNATALTIITSATLIYVADPFSRLYGDDNPEFTGTVTGFVNGDTQESSTTGTLVFSSDATAGSSVGTYAILGSGLMSQNYSFAQAASNSVALTVNPATLTYTANEASRTYGAANPAFSGTVTGFVNGENQGSATTGTLAFTSPANKSSGVGTYAIDGSGLSAQNYIFVQAESNSTALTVDPATLTYTANAADRTYGAANPTFTGTVTGFVNEETQGSATTGTLAFTSPANASSNVGTYAINGSGLSADNYVFVQAESNSTALTVDPATLTYTANAANRIYGAANPAFSGTVTGFVNGENQGSATTGTLAFTSPANASSNVGTYAINGSGLSAQNYVFVQAGGNASALTIDPATLTYTANAASRTYGAVNPAFSGTVAGFVNGDTQGSATTGTLTFGSTANSASNVGKYAINGSGLSAQNYVFVQAGSNATAFTINPATLTISLTGTVTKVFDGTTTATLVSGNYSSLSGIIGNDDVSLASFPTLGLYDTAAVGEGKLVTVSGLTLTGGKASNYTIVGVISGPVGVITPSQPDTGGDLGPPLTGYVTTTTQIFTPAPPPGTVIDALNQAAGNDTNPQGTGAPSGFPPGQPDSGVNPIEGMVLDTGGQNQGDPPTSSDSATAYIVETFDDGPPSGSGSDGSDGNVIIPTLLHAANNGTQGGPVNYSSIPGWGNVALWQ